MRLYYSLKIRFAFKNRRGFSFIEVLIAIVVLSTAIMSLSTVTIFIIKSNTLARDKVAAVTLAKDKMEDIKNLLYSNSSLVDTQTGNNNELSDYYLLSTTNIDYSDGSNPLDDKGGTTGERKFYRYWNIADDFNGYTNTKTIVVIVTWSMYGTTHKIYLTTIKS